MTGHPWASLEGVVHLPGGATGVTDPMMLRDASRSSVRDESLVFGLLHRGEARAYRVSMLESLHVVNERVQGEPIAVTYCMLCKAGVALVARTEGHERLTFRVGSAWRGTMLLEDEQTNSVWRQLDGFCIQGPLTGRRLERVASARLARWSDWKRDHPTSTLLGAEDEAAAAQIETLCAQPDRCTMPGFIADTLPVADERLANDALVLGLMLGETADAWVLDGLGTHAVVEERVADIPVSIWVEDPLAIAVAFDRRLDGRMLSFVFDGTNVRDVETNSRWTLDGLCVEGELKGSRLTALPSTRSQWYAWRLVHPVSGLHGS